MVIGQDRARILAKFYSLDREATDRLIAAWHGLPLSPGGEVRRKTFERRNRMRSKARHYDRLQLSLVECLGLLIPMIDDESKICGCTPASTCEVCAAFGNLGLEPFTTITDAVDRLVALQAKLEAARAARPETP